MDRRSFIYSVSGLTLGPTLSKSSMGWSQETGPRLKIGFLGAAYSHAAPKLKLLQKHPDFDLVGAWDDSPKVRDAVTKQGIPVLSQEEILSRSQVIAVESVVRDHARYAKMALSAGRHVHLEKPRRSI